MSRKTVDKTEKWELLKPVIEDQIQQALRGEKAVEFVFGYIHGIYACEIMTFKEYDKYRNQLYHCKQLES
jgi:hypothetical protein